MKATTYIAALALMIGGISIGCDGDDDDATVTTPANVNRTPGENAKDGLKDLGKATKDATRDAADATGRGLAKTGDAARDAAAKTGEVTRDAVDATGRGLQNMGDEMRDAAATRPTTLPTTRPMSLDVK